jgi:5-methylcytosine-specific restriction endonuclease McrA
VITLVVISVEEVFLLVCLGVAKAPFVDDKGNYWWAKICDSQRLKLFAKSHACVSCDRVGVVFKLEKHYNDKSPHLNLYSQDDVLMTKDHIVSKAKGGKDHMSNYQTMCAECNHKKADK